MHRDGEMAEAARSTSTTAHLNLLRGRKPVELVEQLQHGALHLTVAGLFAVEALRDKKRGRRRRRGEAAAAARSKRARRLWRPDGGESGYLGANGVQLVDEDDGGRLFLGEGKGVAHQLGAVANEHLQVGEYGKGNV